ncbi:olfactory receptor 1030-like [Salvelinus fontinalis]|uniref:olfactory receptor 1030-like n=1 Tax=Salvelinus fontinalis TaxID=8038 RepID=UPI002486A9D3|nr:olfactory receptor 1030-like [Salvelinus fontinalis]
MTWDSSSGREKVVQKGDKFKDIQCQSGQSVIYQLCVKLGAQGWPAFNKPLHTPMYFFICSLAMVDIVYTSGISVTMLNVLLGEERRIPYAPCMIQCFLYHLGTLIFFSYMKIVHVVIHMSSSKDRRKTFSTCVSHMIVVACFFIPKVLRFEGA